ncbi:transposable element Tcb1 transposase [Trichonephila clavipes]|nr:transposable element Tcb1 transposase [Trichonephila clavipes]
MARIVRHNDESVREGYIRNGGKEVKLFTSALKAFECNNRIVMAQRKHLDDFLRGRIIGRLECGRTQLEVFEKLGITQSVISRLWQRFQDDGNVSRCYCTGRPRVTTPNEDRYLAVTAKRNRRSTASDLSRQLSSATGTTVSRQIVYRRLGPIGLYARRPVRCAPLTATQCHLQLTWRIEHALWTPQQWSCVMFSDECRLSLQSDSRRTLIWRAPGIRYHQENTIVRHRYGSAGWLARARVWGGIFLGSRTDPHVQSVTMTGHIYRDVILEQHVGLFRGAVDAEFLFMDDNARPHRANILSSDLFSVWLAIHQNDHQARRRFVEWAQNEIAVVPDFHKRILFSDEAHFWLNGCVNKQNCHIWSEANPQVYVETPLHSEKLTVWCSLWAGGIIDPYFFKNDEGHNVTVNGDRYRAMITNFFIPELNIHDVQELWFQQDGATCHTARATIDLLKDTFGDRLISRFGLVNWPPRSCDLTPLDYFLWGYVKSLVYADKPQTLDHLEDNIRRVIADIRPQMLEKVIENLTSRLDYI